jgi:hypothetical protein
MYIRNLEMIRGSMFDSSVDFFAFDYCVGLRYSGRKTMFPLTPQFCDLEFTRRKTFLFQHHSSITTLQHHN